jgi:putative Mg2+ transporter-C (MgtC) family protein
MTVIGLCFRGGQILLGSAATGLAFTTLWALKWIEVRIPREQEARLGIKTADDLSIRLDLENELTSLGYKVLFYRQCSSQEAGKTNFGF